LAIIDVTERKLALRPQAITLDRGAKLIKGIGMPLFCIP
jgi:hypothetical protein